MDLGILDYIGLFFVILANVCFYFRKGILAKNGIETGMFDPYFRDHGKLNSLIEKLSDPKLVQFYQKVNYGFPVCMGLSVFFFVISRVING
jgi:hypothetical protein